MKHRHLFICIFCFSPLFSLHAQEFIGYVKKFDTVAVAAFQAKVKITGEDNLSNFVKTYFDGSFRFTPEKKKTYSIYVSYPGYTDTTFTVSCDKKGVVSPPSVTAVLRKDGMRLVGTIRSAEDNFPVKGATIAVKNIMTQQEQRATTDIDGYFNLKLDYETMYRVYIDKYSPGVANRYKDTSLYVSTVRFNKPVDYRLDILLSNATTKITVPEGYKSDRVPLNKNVKPVVEVKALTDTTASLKETPSEKKQQEAAVTPASAKSTGAVADSAVTKTETVQAGTSASAQAEPAFVPDESLIVVMSNDLKSAVEDSVGKVKAEQKKAYEDSVSRAAEAAQKATAEVNSFDALRAETERLEQEIQAQKRRADSLTKAALLLRKKFTEDSIKQEKIKQQEIARKKAFDDSVRTALELKRKKEIADSLLAVKLEKERIAREALERKKREDSIATALALARKKFVEDSVKLEKLRLQELARKKAYDDSVNTALEAKRRKEVADSTARAKAEKDRLALLAAIQKAKEDSVANAMALAAKKLTDDSIKQAKALAGKKAAEDSLKLVLLKKTRQAAADSAKAVNAENERRAKEYLAAREAEDSIAYAKLQWQKQQTEDSLKQVILAQQAALAKRQEEERKKAGADPLAETAKQENKLVRETAGLDVSEQIMQPQNPNSSYTIKSTAKPKVRYKILFAKNSYRLNSYAKEGLAKAIQFMKANKNSELKIYGNYAENEKNTEELMQLRTDVIIKVLLENGISVDRISVYSPKVEKLSYDWGTVGELLKQFRWTILEISDY